MFVSRWSAIIDWPDEIVQLQLDEAIHVKSDFAYIGGLPDIITKVMSETGKVSSVGKPLFDNNFRGLFQDIRINKQFLLFDKQDVAKLESDEHILNDQWEVKLPQKTSNVATPGVDKDPCTDNPCQNNAKCKPDSQSNGFTCEVAL